jgi:GMP synthase-like glutamine amidotransferase
VTQLPSTAQLLASSDAYEVQAFRVGDVAWGLQFHIEATVPMLADWARGDADAVAALGRTPDDIVAEVSARGDDLVAVGRAIIERFAKVVTG